MPIYRQPPNNYIKCVIILDSVAQQYGKTGSGATKVRKTVVSKATSTVGFFPFDDTDALETHRAWIAARTTARRYEKSIVFSIWRPLLSRGTWDICEPIGKGIGEWEGEEENGRPESTEGVGEVLSANQEGVSSGVASQDGEGPVAV